MPDSIREQLMEAITDSVGGVFALEAAILESELPGCFVADVGELSSDDAYGLSNPQLTISVSKAVESTSTDRDQMRKQANNVLADIITDIYADPTFGSLADNVEYISGVIQAEANRYVFAEAQFVVRYHFVRSDPYTHDE